MSEYSDFIDDGYTENGHIDAEAGIHGPLDFEYRPMVPQVQARTLAKKDGDEFINAMSKELAGEKDALVKSWSLMNSKKESVPVTEANIKRLRPRLYDKLWQVVAGVRASDGGKPLDLEGDRKN